MDEDEELQVVPPEHSSELDLQVWDEDISDVQKALYESQRCDYEKYKSLKIGVQERKTWNSLEFWRKKKAATAPTTVTAAAALSSSSSGGVQRIQLAQKTSYPIVISTSSTTQPQTFITGRINYAPATSVSTVHTRPQLSTVRTSKPAEITTPPSIAQPMSVLHRNAVQPGNVRAASVVPTQHFPQLLFDTTSGLLIMPTAQTGMNAQSIAIRPTGARQPAPNTSRPVTGVTAASLVATRLVSSTTPVTTNPQLQQQQQQAVLKAGLARAYTSPTIDRGGTAVGNVAKSISILQPKTSTAIMNPKTGATLLQQQQQQQQQTTVTTLIQRGIPTTVKTSTALTSSNNNNGVKAVRLLSLANPQTGSSNGLAAAASPSGIKEDMKNLNKPATTVSITKISGGAADKGSSVNGVEKATVMNGSTSSDSNNNTNSKTFPSLVVNVKPCLQEKPARHEINASRAELDQLVKNALVYAPSRFTEWLMQKGLLRLEHKCFLHKGEDGQPVQFKLGMYSDKDKEPFSGGYVWISDCCSGRQISVYEGSIFDSSQHPPTTLLKLIYHWACQTSAANVLNWCKVSGGYLKNFYTLLRSVCVGALHELCPKMGGPGKYVEIGIITLGTTLTAPTGKKQVKIEILGVFDPETKMIRMKLINPQQPMSSLSDASKTRGVQILSPLNIWVEKSSTILIDGSIEQDLLLDMGFTNLAQCQAPTDEDYDPKAPTNVNVMNYLKHVVPKMFQNTLCVLSKSLIQQFLDELSWREKWGITPSSAFDNILEHIKTMTNWDFGPSGNLVSWLNKISMNPFQDWSYSRALHPSGIDLLPDSIRQGDVMPSLSSQVIENRVGSSNGVGGIGGGGSGASSSGSLRNASKPPVLLPQVPTLTVANGPLKRKPEPTSSTPNLMEYFLKTPKSLILESYYYGEIPSTIQKEVGGEFPQNVKCPLCSKPFFTNTEVYRHIYSHVHAIGRASATINFCNYCLKDVPTSGLPAHILECHKMSTGEGYSCRICQERFSRESAFVIHMWENHCEADTPYVCELCDYRSSFHYQVVDHFNQSHKGCDSVLCPTCMKILPAKSFLCLKQITVHIQTHQMRKGKKCSHCVLVFSSDSEYRSHIVDFAHKGRPHSRKIIYYNPGDEEGLSMAKPPPFNRTVLAPPPKKPKTGLVMLDSGGSGKRAGATTPTTPTGGIGIVSKPSTSSSVSDSMYSIREHNVRMHGVGQRGCLECHTSIEKPEHFPGYMSCIKCRFSTCCKSAMQLHHASAHPSFGKGRRGSSIRVRDTEMLEQPLLCPCGFETINPNRLARHLALCDKKTAYPLDWEEQEQQRVGQPPAEPLTPLDHLEMMRDPNR